MAPGRLKLLHANDSKDACGSKRDRHENIGAGRIGEQAFAELMRHPVAARVPLCIETPGGAGKHRADIELLKKLRAAVVNMRALADVGRTLGLGDYVYLGRGEESTGGRDKDSILADTVEAIIGAVGEVDLFEHGSLASASVR